MSTDIGPGTPLIFIGPEHPLYPSALTIGALYFVASMVPNFPCPMPGVALRDSPGRYKSYCACAFKPFGEPDEEMLREELDTVARDFVSASAVSSLGKII